MSEVYWLSQAFDMIERYVACVQAAFADPHLVRFEMTTNFGCALNAESIIDCLSQKKFYAIPSYQRAYKWDTEHPKISGFGAVDDVGKRPISLWHKQTPGILGVDFYPDRLYNIL